MSASLASIPNRHEAAFAIDLTNLVQAASVEDVRVLLAQLSCYRSAVVTTLSEKLLQLIHEGVFAHSERPTSCVIKGIFTYSNPYFSRVERTYVPQSAEDVRVHFQEIIDSALTAIDFPISLQFEVQSDPFAVHVPWTYSAEEN